MTTIAFTGDIAFSKYFADSWKDPAFIHDEVKAYLNSAPYVVANIESPFTADEIQSDRPLNHASNPQAVSCLKELNANIWNLSNNHILDCGEKGMADTIALAESNGFRTVGAGHNVQEAIRSIDIPESGGIGIFSVTYRRGEFIRAKEDAPGCILFEDTERIKAKIAEIKKTNRWCIVIAHGGEEFSSMPLPSVRQRYLEFLDYGADIVVGHHPHVLQNYETVGNKIVFYSLGNFIFDTNYQRIQNFSEYGVLLKLHFTEDTCTWDAMATKIDRQTQTIGACPAPDIFCDVADRDYQLVKPLIVKAFYKNNKKARCFSEPHCKEYGEKEWFDHYAGRLGADAVRDMDASLATFDEGTWKTAEETVYKFLLASMEDK